MELDFIYWKTEVAKLDQLLGCATDEQASNLLRGLVWLASGVQKKGHQQEVMDDLKRCLLKFRDVMGTSWLNQNMVLASNHASESHIAELVAHFLANSR